MNDLQAVGSGDDVDMVAAQLSGADATKCVRDRLLAMGVNDEPTSRRRAVAPDPLAPLLMWSEG
jgi:hypothetical protein